MKKLIQLAILLFSLNCYSQNSIDPYPCIDVSNIHQSNITTIHLHDQRYFRSDTTQNTIWYNEEREVMLFVDSVYHNDTLYIFDNWIEIVRTSSPKISLQDILDYQKECYNDSFQVDINVNPDRNENGTLLYYPPIWEKQWKHNQTTFEGFIEWITNKKLIRLKYF